MSIDVKLDLLMSQKQISLTDLSNKVGISIVNLSILKNNRAKAIRFSTLEAICDALECQPGELLQLKKTE